MQKGSSPVILILLILAILVVATTYFYNPEYIFQEVRPIGESERATTTSPKQVATQKTVSDESPEEPIPKVEEEVAVVRQNTSPSPEEVVVVAATIDDPEPPALLPEPVIRYFTGTPGELTKEGIFLYTNKERVNHGLHMFSQNTALNAAALRKVEDMFANQYFAHDSPQGVGVSDWAERVGYEYIIVGENLALGGFEDDADVVQGWMDSPGHRENILKESFTEIGIAAQEGVLDGDKVYLAVQIFGRPLSLCPNPDSALKGQLEAMDSVAEGLHEAITTFQSTLESYNPKNPAEYAEYNTLVGEYNSLVDEYNSMIRDYKSLAETYNAQVAAFNECIASI